MSLNNAKRHRTQSQTSSSTPSSPETHPPNKASRTIPALESATDGSTGAGAGTGVTAHPLLCTLPPTCNHRPTPIANTRDLEAHYAMYHAHVCEQPSCGSVFPDARLLELHQTECHDPLAAVRKDRGEKIFACHLPTCPKLFLTPKARRLHLIQAHGYPKEYFFAVTNKGVGGLLKRWGEGASMIRGEWKARDLNTKGADADLGLTNTDHSGESGESGEEEESGSGSEDQDHTPGATKYAELSMDEGEYAHDRPAKPANSNNADDGGGDSLMDGLTNTMGSLTLVPSSIRFGRGGKNGGFVHNSRGGGGGGVPEFARGGGGGRGRGRGGVAHGFGYGYGHVGPHQMGMDVDSVVGNAPGGGGSGGVVRGGGRGGLGWAGRGRAGIVHIPGRARGMGGYGGFGMRGRGGGVGVRNTAS